MVTKIVDIGVRYELSSPETSFIAVYNYNWTTFQSPTSGFGNGMRVANSASRGQFDEDQRSANDACAMSKQILFTLLFVLSFLLRY